MSPESNPSHATSNIKNPLSVIEPINLENVYYAMEDMKLLSDKKNEESSGKKPFVLRRASNKENNPLSFGQSIKYITSLSKQDSSYIVNGVLTGIYNLIKL